MSQLTIEIIHYLYDRVNFKKNEKAYNSAGSEVLKALKECENDPQEPGNKFFFLLLLNLQENAMIA